MSVNSVNGVRGASKKNTIKIAAEFQQHSLLRLNCICAVLLVSIFLLDLSIASGVAIGVLYVTVLLLTLRTPHRKVTIIVGIISSILIVGVVFHMPPAVEQWKVLLNRRISLFAVWITVILGLAKNVAEQQRQAILHEREKALEGGKNSQRISAHLLVLQ